MSEQKSENVGYNLSFAPSSLSEYKHTYCKEASFCCLAVQDVMLTKVEKVKGRQKEPKVNTGLLRHWCLET
jgi:hypothetical protein